MLWSSMSEWEFLTSHNLVQPLPRTLTAHQARKEITAFIFAAICLPKSQFPLMRLIYPYEFKDSICIKKKILYTLKETRYSTNECLQRRSSVNPFLKLSSEPKNKGRITRVSHTHTLCWHQNPPRVGWSSLHWSSSCYTPVWVWIAKSFQKVVRFLYLILCYESLPCMYLCTRCVWWSEEGTGFPELKLCALVSNPENAGN